MSDSYKACQGVVKTQVYSYLGMGLAVGQIYWDTDVSEKSICTSANSEEVAQSMVADKVDSFCAPLDTAQCKESGYTLCEKKGPVLVQKNGFFLARFLELYSMLKS
ncbi:MAG: hypothetical protein Q7T03_01845 [Deltaproteobacteria bacterium]|nr:hypothetical protein [Deltaproteobacteria bacterium]